MNKYEWIEAVMASKMKHGVKTFAFGIYKHMNKEGTCFPGDEALMAATGMGRGHFAEYRKALFEGGWIDAEVRKTKNGNSYTYSLPASLPENATVGEQTATVGEQSATVGEQTATVRGMNTVTNTSSNTTSNPSITPPVADAPVDVSLQGEVREIGKSRFSYIPRNSLPSSLPNRTQPPVYFLDLSGFALETRTAREVEKVTKTLLAQQKAAERREAVLVGMGIDPHGEW